MAFTNKGKWKIKRDTLVLDLDPEQPNYKIETAIDANVSGKLIEIRPETNSDLVRFAKVFVNDTTLNQSDSGIYKTNIKTVHKLSIFYLGGNYNIPLSDNNWNHCIVSLYHRKITGFHIEKNWVIEGDKLKNPMDNHILFRRMKD